MAYRQLRGSSATVMGIACRLSTLKAKPVGYGDTLLDYMKKAAYVV